MTNKQILVIRQIKKVLKAVGFEVGEYPFDVDTLAMGDWNKVALIQDGDELTLEETQNLTITKDYSVIVWIYSNIKIQQIDNILDIQASAEDAILDDLTLAGTAYCTNIASVEKGTYLDQFTGYDVGYSGNRTCRRLNFSVTLQQEI